MLLSSHILIVMDLQLLMFRFRLKLYRYLKNYKNGEMHGEWISWHENGQMSCKKYFEDGNRTGKVTNWDEKGNII